MGSRRTRSTSPSRRRYRTASTCSTDQELNALTSSLILLLATSSLILVVPPLTTPDEPIETDFKIPSFDEEKMYSDNMNSAEQHYEPQELNQYITKDHFSGFHRPMGLRWRDDSRINRFADVQAMPILAEHRSVSPFGRTTASSRPTTSRQYQYDSPSLEDIDLIDVLWRSDIAGEKGTRQVAPAEQYECDLQTLTEKSTVAPLTAEENARYEDLSKSFYQDFYPSFANNNHNNNNNHFSKNTVKPTVERTVSIPTDEDLAELLEDVSKAEGQLNLLFEDNNQNPILNNVSMSEGIIYTQSNLTEMQEIRDQRNQLQISTTLSSSEAAPETLFNSTDPTVQQWIQPSEMTPNDVFPTTNYAFVPMHNDSLQAVVSNGNIEYDHAYQNARSTAQPQQAVSMSPVFDPYHANRHSFSDCTDSSSTCSRVSSESPRYNSESSDTPVSRFFGKLIPSQDSSSDDEILRQAQSPKGSKIGRIIPLGGSGQRKRGRQSKDEQLASENSLPVSAYEISEMSLSELQHVLKNEKLTEYQRQLIRKIRRRGKNKVAARTCRLRRTDRHDKALNMSFM